MKASRSKSNISDQLIDTQLHQHDFFTNVYDVVKQVPRGRVSTYGAIANYLGSKSGARMVGWALNGCIQQGNDVPAHRVVNRNGMLSGKMHFATPTQMQALLEAEGIVVENDQVTAFEQLFWNPSVELTL